MKFATHGTRALLIIYSGIALLAWPASTTARSAEESAQATDSHCDACIIKAIDLGPQAKDVTAEFFIPPNLSLEFPEVHLNYLPNGGIQGGFYVVKNDSKAGLVTLRTSWYLHVDDPNAPAAPGGQSISSWATGHAFLAPGASENEQLSFGLVPYKGHAVVRITGIVTYAEFEDGTRLGPGAGTLYPAIRARREKLLNDYRTVLAMIRAGKPDTELEAYVESSRGLEWMGNIRAREGWNGVAAEITRRLRLIGQNDR